MAVHFVKETKWLLVIQAFWKHLCRLGRSVSNGFGKSSNVAKDRRLSRKDLLAALGEISKVQQVVQEKIMLLSQRLIIDGKTELSFCEAFEKIQTLELPRDPLEKYGITDAELQHILVDYEEDSEVMMARMQLLNPGRDVGDPAAVQRITINKIIQVHQLMDHGPDEVYLQCVSTSSRC
eukprot:gnl/MRDRNA2_/MRDRNA2_47123_c0_seq1.p1 gnl/MRDRNA2_/MRDRNA2_47123_c0~~gnl/MRDRNA2_/MRDRNA2_47123_c0_seq1.p1  ORF type:complete len:197 (+),score=30.45 gnl/MRDRNA2_/MRDRNA2_47123_c0_seq1:55-591(+)